MSKAYDPDARTTSFRVKYMVSTTGDRWFIPYNNSGTTAAQLAQCKKVVGQDSGDAEHGVQVVA